MKKAMEWQQFLIAAILLLFTCVISYLWYYSYSFSHSGLSPIPINLPILGMIPSVVFNLHRIPDYAADVLKQTQGSFLIKGPWFSKLELLLTADPTNLQYVMCKHHQDFHRGANFKEMFAILGEGLLNSDFDKWKYQRKIGVPSLSSPRFRQYIVETLQSKLETGLIPILDRSYNQGLVVDLQDIFLRLATDITFKLFIGCDPNSLSFDSPSHFGGITSTDEPGDAIVARHVLPAFVWKLQRRLGIGKERKLTELTQAIDNFTYQIIAKKREEAAGAHAQAGGAIDLVGLYIDENYGADPDYGFISTDVFLRDTFVSFLIAGKDTVSSALAWFFWLLIKNPRVEAKIKEELKQEQDNIDDISKLGNADKLVYLHAALCETLRLYPPVPYVHRAANEHGTLPSGHPVKPWTMIILSGYALARMEWVWGKDCEEFKPERWITEKGTLKHEASHKFFAFNTGPRICIGKELAFLEMKAAVCHVLCGNYRFEVVEGHRVEPASSVVLRMEHGLKVKVMKNGAGF